jgi:hypothetical protein
MREGNDLEVLFFLSTFFLSVFRDEESGISQRCAFGGLTETTRTEKRGINGKAFAGGEKAITGNQAETINASQKQPITCGRSGSNIHAIEPEFDRRMGTGE